MKTAFAVLAALSSLGLSASDCLVSIPEFKIKAVWSPANAQASLPSNILNATMYLFANMPNSPYAQWTRNNTINSPDNYIWSTDGCGYLTLARQLYMWQMFQPYVDLGANYVEGTTVVPTVEVKVAAQAWVNSVATPGSRYRKIRTCVDPVTKELKMNAESGRDKIFLHMEKLIISSDTSPLLPVTWWTRMYPTIYAV